MEFTRGYIKTLSMCFIFVVCASFTLSGESKAAETKSAALNDLMDEIWQYELSQFPAIARSEGHSTDRFFTDVSMPAMQARNKNFRQFLSRLSEFKENELSESDQISLFMQQYRLNNYVDQFEFGDYRVPITSEYGFHSSIASALSNFQIRRAGDFDVYLGALNEVPGQINQHIEYMKQGLEIGHVQPKVVLIAYEDTIKPYVEGKNKQHPFYAPVKTIGFELNEEQQSALDQAVHQAADAYADFFMFFIEDYRPNAKDNIAASTWPRGVEYYDNRSKYFTTTELSAQEIHDIGLKEVARIRAEMQAIVDELEFDGDINAFIEFLRTDPQFYAETPEELIINASYISKKMDAKLPRLFYKMPRTPYGVAPVPDSIAPKYTTGRYIAPRRDDQPGYYWVNTYALDKRPLYALPALTLHEAVPGHHFQISLAAEMQDLPKVRRKTYISAFGEGWGLYSEFLGLEVGMYEDPYDNFGRLSYEMWRACRLVVDTGMHMFGWSRDKALNYMLENTALSEHNVRTEIDRYISWPAQALSYKIGEIKIKQLRAKAENALGEKFDLRAFHDAVLANGSVPLLMLENSIDKFIQEQADK